MNLKRAIAMALVTGALTVALGYASRAPYAPRTSAQAILRLSWRLRGEKLQTCRARTPQELATLPVHMRTPQVCTGHLVSYRLAVRIDDAPPDTMTFLPAGAKGDRPVFVLHDVALEPGPHAVTVDFTPRERIPGSRLKPLRFQATLNARLGRVALITLGSNGSGLVLAD